MENLKAGEWFGIELFTAVGCSWNLVRSNYCAQNTAVYI